MTGPVLAWQGKGTPDIEKLRSRVRTLNSPPSGEACEGGRVLIRGHAHEVAAWLHPAAGGKVDLIYIDPPFCVGSDFNARVQMPNGTHARFAYSDRWSSTEGYLDFLHHLIVLSHSLLADDGAMYLHVDRRTSHWARCILAEVFGSENDRGTIAWHLGNGVKSKHEWGCSHNDIACFSKGSTFKFRVERSSMREPFAAASLDTHFRSVDENGRRYRDKHANGKRYRYYADQGRLIGSVWTDCPSMNARSPLMDESTGYPTQKPEKLLERIIEASSDPGDLVLDLCCGSGTTPAVAQRLGRRWLAADIGAFAIAQTAKRLRRQEPTIELQLCDLVPIQPARAHTLARLLGCNHPQNTINTGLIGQNHGRTIAIWPHGIVPTQSDLKEAFKHAPSGSELAAFATQFESGSAGDDDRIACWRYHPEVAHSASLRSVFFVQHTGEVLTINPGTLQKTAEWTIHPNDQSTSRGEINRFGFSHTLGQQLNTQHPEPQASGTRTTA